MTDFETSDHTEIRVFPLIRGKEYLILRTPETDDLPDRDALAEIRMAAYRAADKKTLGAVHDIEHVVLTLAEYAAQGVLGELAWSAITEFPAMRRYVTRWRSKSRPDITELELRSVVKRVVEVMIGHSVVSLTIMKLHRLTDGNGWEILARADGETLELTVEGSGRLITAQMHGDDTTQ